MIWQGTNAMPQGPGTGDLASIFVRAFTRLPVAVYKVCVSVIAIDF